jgi:uncharacterized membrane protein
MSAEGHPGLPPRAAVIPDKHLPGIAIHGSERWRISLSKNGVPLALCAIILLGAGLRVYALDYQSLWADEVFSLMATDPALILGEFWDRLLVDTHPPIYSLVLRWSSTLFGQSEIAARMPSAFFGILTLCAAAIFPGLSLSRNSRLAFLLFLALSPGAVWYAREARSYALLLFLSTVITLACIRCVHSSAHQDRKARGAIVMLTIAATLASFTHYFGFLVAAAAFLTCFLLTNRRRRTIVAIAGSGVIAAFLPWVVYHSQFMDVGRVAWIGDFPVAASLHWFEYLSFGGAASLGLFTGIAVVLLAAGGWLRLAAWPSTIWACALLCLLTLAAAVGISLYTPILTSRNMIVVLPALYLIAAELSSYLASRWGKLAGMTYLATQVGLMSEPLAANFTSNINDQWRDSAAFVMQTKGCESGAVHVYGNAAPYRFFTRSLRPNLDIIEIPEGATADLGNEPMTSCTVVLWVVEVAPWDLNDLLSRLGLWRPSLEVVEYHNAFVILRKSPS